MSAVQGEKSLDYAREGWRPPVAPPEACRQYAIVHWFYDSAAQRDPDNEVFRRWVDGGRGYRRLRATPFGYWMVLV